MVTANGEIKLSNIKITSSTNDAKEGLVTSVIVDGMEVADKITSVEFKAHGRDLPTVTLEFPVGELEIVGKVNVERVELFQK